MNANARKEIDTDTAGDLIGQSYTFKSSPGMHPSLIKARVTAEVSITQNSLCFKANHPKFISTDSVELEQITEIKRRIKFAPQYILFAVIAAAYAILSRNYWFLAFSPALVIRGMNFAVALIRKSGSPVIIFSAQKKAADALEINLKRLLAAGTSLPAMNV